MSASSSTYRVLAPPARKPPLHVLIPSTYAEDAAHLREKTLRIGFLFRAMAIFRVDKMIIYHEDPSRPSKNAGLIKLICDYMSTAPYLRRRLFKLRPELKYVGLLPPLNIPTHPESPEPPEGLWELREALVERRGKLALIHAGLKKAITLDAPLRNGAKIIVLTRRHGKKVRVRVRSRKRLPYYLGTTVSLHDGPLIEILSKYRYAVATDKNGVPLTDVADRLRLEIRGAEGPVCVAFGSYERGLDEIAALQGASLDKLFNVCVNFIPHQGVRSVRTEEAVYAVLSFLNNLI
ncbi:MAG: putative RNA uridine N3 methyltransferase [Candidatus Caldarchaeales archaeon]|jgi:predicted SPOUT superfamily RNA methylase MTH1|nr:putative RNA uridine N3 methyltransferase [Candidatus Caldarchaeales archaeon]